MTGRPRGPHAEPDGTPLPGRRHASHKTPADSVAQAQEAVTSVARTGRANADDRPTGLYREGDGIVRNKEKILMSRDNVLAVAQKYGLDLNGVKFSLDMVRRGSGPGREFFGVTMPDGHIKLARDAFMNEEQLARTLAHERFHLDELRSGRDFPWEESARAAYESRAYAYEERWWQAHKHLVDAE